MPHRKEDSEDSSEGETLLDTDEEDSYDSANDSAGSLEDFIADEDEPLLVTPTTTAGTSATTRKKGLSIVSFPYMNLLTSCCFSTEISGGSKERAPYCLL